MGGAVLGDEALAEIAESGAAIEDVDVVVDAHFDAGGVSAIAHVLPLRGGSGAANSPESDLHAPFRTVESRIHHSRRKKE